MAEIHTIGVANGGGGAPGLNAVIRGVVKSAIGRFGWRVTGICNGFDNLIWPEGCMPLTWDTVSGILPRGGSPSPFDRTLATRFGVAASELLARGEFGRMVCLHGGKIDSVPLEEAVAKLKRVDPQGELVRTARSLGMTFGDES